LNIATNISQFLGLRRKRSQKTALFSAFFPVSSVSSSCHHRRKVWKRPVAMDHLRHVLFLVNSVFEQIQIGGGIGGGASASVSASGTASAGGSTSGGGLSDILGSIDIPGLLRSVNSIVKLVGVFCPPLSQVNILDWIR
jgi:hypothetical protein